MGALGGWQGCMGHWGGIGGYVWKMNMVYCKVLLKTQDSLLQIIEHELRSTRPHLIPLLATRCLFLGALMGHEGEGVHLAKHQTDPQADYMSCWPALLPLLITRCLYWGWDHWGLTGVVGGVRGDWVWHMKNEDIVLQSTLVKLRQSIADNRTWAQVNQTSVSTTPGHQIPLPGGIEEHVGGMGRVHLTKHQSDPQADDMSWWHHTALHHYMPLGGMSDQYDGILCGSLSMSSVSSIADYHELHPHFQMSRKVLCVCRLLFLLLLL